MKRSTFVVHQTRSLIGRIFAWTLILAMTLTSVPALSAAPAAAGAVSGSPGRHTGTVNRTIPNVQPAPATSAFSETATGAGPVRQARLAKPGFEKPKVNRTIPSVRPVPLVPQFSETPTDREIFRARVFEEPLVPVGGTTTTADNRALADAVSGFVAAGQTDDLSTFEAYLQDHQDSPWRASLLLNMGLVYRKASRFSRALASWEQAWRLAKDQTDPFGQAVADRALGELAYWRMGFAQLTETELLLKEAAGRKMRGSAAEKVHAAQTSLWAHRREPDRVRPSASTALDRILTWTKADYRGDPRLEDYRAPQYGVTLTQTAALAGSLGLNLQLANWKDRQAEIPVPAVAHLGLGHFTAIVKADRAKGLYLVDDPLVGGQRWLSGAVLAEEASGYFLIPSGSLTDGWRRAAREEGDNVFGRCLTSADPDRTRPCDDTQGGDGGCSRCLGMPRYRFHSLLSSLNIVDTPLGYTPARGPSVEFTVTYNQREAGQPQIFSYSNFGPRWTFDYLSFIEDDPSWPGADVKLHPRGGGAEPHTGFDGQRYTPSAVASGILTRTSSSPIRYELAHKDGSVDVYAQPDGAFSAGRRVFLTELIDAQGARLRLIYDEDLRIVAVVDALAQVTTLSYDFAPDSSKITKVTDPFGRSAVFEYDDTGALVGITDVIGLTSRFEYGANYTEQLDASVTTTMDFIDAMTTPYGTTKFRNEIVDPDGIHGDPQVLEATDPLGATERLEQRGFNVGQPTREEAVPAGFSSMNAQLDNNNTYYWDKRATALFPGQYDKAVITHWHHGTLYGLDRQLGTKHSEKRPLEGRVWYGYSDPKPDGDGSQSGRPTAVARVLDDGSSQIYRYEYNSKGKTTRSTDPLGRTTLYVYAPNEIDLLEVRQVNGTSTELLASYSYNDKHQQLTSTDAAGQTTTTTYTTAGQVQTVTDAKGETTTYAYNSNDQLTSVTGPVSGATTTIEYDGYGRVWRVTDSDGYAVTTQYDALDRPTVVTYPDGTYEQTVYEKLDAVKQRGRLGRWTQTFYDALRRPVATRDPAGRTTQLNAWVSCPSGCGGGGAKLSKLIDANGNPTTWEYDLQGRATQEIRANSATYNYTYENTTSRQQSTTDPNGNVKTFTYNRDSSLAGVTYQPGAGVAATPNVSFTYDPTYGRVATMTDGTGTTNYSYYPVGVLGAGKLQSVDGSLDNDTITYGYDELGRVTSSQVGGSSRTETQQFDALGRLTTLTNPLGNFTYAYDGVTRRPLSVTYPNGQQTTYAYFGNLGDRRLQEIWNKKPGGATLSKFDYTYDTAGNILTWRQQNEASPAQVYELGYDDADQLTAAILKSTDPTPVVLKRYYYAYDPAGNRTAAQNDDAVTGATYNNMNQLVSQAAGGALIFKGTVSEPATVTVGGRPATVTADGHFAGQAVVAPSGTTDVQVTATDYASPNRNTRTNTYRVSESGAGKSFTFDPNGNMTSDGARTFTWDAENRLVRVSVGGSEIASFGYNAARLRTRKTTGGMTTQYVLAEASVVEERLSTGAVTRHFQGEGVDSVLASEDGSGAVSYAVADHLGSVTQRTDTAGNVLLVRQYDPLGNPVAGRDVPGWSYTGREWDTEIGLYYYRARYYDPMSGNFISGDPIHLKGGPNLYAYVAGNPVGATDPSGLLQVRIAYDINYDYGVPFHGRTGISSVQISTALESCKKQTNCKDKLEFVAALGIVMSIGPGCPEHTLSHEQVHAQKMAATIHAWLSQVAPFEGEYDSFPACRRAWEKAYALLERTNPTRSPLRKVLHILEYIPCVN
jgi:RHS repeat-associated protein